MPRASRTSRRHTRTTLVFPFAEPLDTDEGWAKYNLHYWRRDFRGFLEFFFSQQIPEPHSTKQIEDCVGWGLETDPETLALADEEAPLPWGSTEEAEALCKAVSCPVLVVHGELDACQTRERAEAVAALTGGTLVAPRGGGPRPAGASSREGEPADPRLRRVARKENVMELVTDAAREQTRARYPDEEGFVERNGVRVFYEVYGDAPTTFLLFPTGPISHSRLWKAQIPYLSRYFRVITFDPRGNGRSDRPRTPDAYSRWEFVEDGRAILAAAGAETALLGGLCHGGGSALMLAATYPASALGVFAIAPFVPMLTPAHPNYLRFSFDDELETEEAWAKCNSHYWRRDYRGFLEFFFSQQLPEPHSTKQIEDAVEWGLAGDVESVILSTVESGRPWESQEDARALCGRVRCPVLVLYGELDGCQPREEASAVVEYTGGTLVTMEGVGHFPQARHPVKVNGLMREFAESVVQPKPTVKTWTRALSRRRRALFICSPIGLGHAQRDVAIARELRQLVPDLEIDWLAQHPVTKVLEGEGERVHPMSAELANESGHMESESAEHDLHCFQAWRRMDEILLANFMVFHDVAREENYDLWIGDEAWELDYYLHENPEEKRAAYAWLTDFVGWLPMPDGGEREAFLTADYNAEMIEHIARYPARPRPGDLRREPRRRRRRLVRAGASADPRLDGAALRLRRLRLRLRPCGLRRPREAPRRARLPRRASRSASSPSAARASAAICSGASSTRSRRRRSSCPSCAWSSSPGRGSTRRRSPRPTASRCAPTSTTSTGTWPPATSRSSRAG